MKTPNNNVFLIIKSMSPAEKRYFKRHYASDKNRLTELFDYINSQKVYDEQQIRQEFAGTKLEKNLKVYKIQLSDLLLKSLASLYYKDEPKRKVLDSLKEVDLLFSRQLFEIGISKTKKIKQFCIDKFQHLSLPAILSREAHYQNNFNLHDQEILTLSEIKNQLNSKSLFIDNKIKLATINKKLQYRQSWIASEKERPFFEEIIASIQSSQSQVYYPQENYLKLLLIAKANHCLNETAKAKRHYQQLITEYFYTDKRETIPNQYFNQTFTGLAKIEITNNQYESALSTINQLKQLNQNQELYKIIELNIYFIEASILMHGGFCTDWEVNFSNFLNLIKQSQLEKQPITQLTLLAYVSYFMSLKKYDVAYRVLLKTKKNNTSTPLIIKQVKDIMMAMSKHQFSLSSSNMSNVGHRASSKPENNNFYTELISFFNDINKSDSNQHPHIVRSFEKILQFYKFNELLNTLNTYGFKSWLKQIQNNSALLSAK